MLAKAYILLNLNLIWFDLIWFDLIPRRYVRVGRSGYTWRDMHWVPLLFFLLKVHLYILTHLHQLFLEIYRVVHKGWDYRDDCTELTLHCFIFFMIPWTCKLVSFFSKSLNKPLKDYIQRNKIIPNRIYSLYSPVLRHQNFRQ